MLIGASTAYPEARSGYASFTLADDQSHLTVFAH